MAIANGVGEGRLTIAPYAAGGARLALAPVQLVATNAGYAIDTAATIDGPLGDGAVRGLSLPVAARIDKDGGFALNPRCATLAFESLAVAGLVLAPARLPLCPTGRALLVKTDGGAVAGGAAIAGLKLAGHLSGSPLTMVSQSFRFDVGTPGFTANAVAVRLGQGDSVSRLDLARIAGRIDSKGVAGQFDGAAGKIAAVPLLLSEGQGGWRLAKGDLTLDATLRVADDAVDPRFNPLQADSVRLTLIDGKIHTTGQLREPSTGVSVADLVIDHDLGRAAGRALLDVPGITFGRALQPEKLTRLTLGVVANVEGSVRGQGRIDWADAGVTSGGTFRTDSLNLAAAFGPVAGLSGEIHFSDLLGLETPPGQEVRLAEVNPGVAVTEGVVRYQLLPGQQVRIEGGRWPFSGGELFMEPTTLDFVQPVARHMTFRVAGLDAALFIQRFEFDNIAGTGTFDGTLPIVFDDQGGRIENGRLVVRQGGGTLAYVGELSNEDLGTYGKMAFDALKAIRYDNLAIELNGNLDGEIVSQIVFAGVNEQPLGGNKLDGMAKELTGLPFKFNIVVRAPFRGLVSTATTFVDPTGLIRNQRTKDGEPPVQPHESEGKR
ncbi:YdbH domain-containing protein [Sphingomonas sp. KC8]|uniref:YdbH domain-containing protein n=1 Tax=Sphingomonas sp. KC8 TaxID=1030157 RepID=UPI000A03171D|nr:YdbH domain-containing protein [Sphingomonas sp. KC8]